MECHAQIEGIQFLVDLNPAGVLRILGKENGSKSRLKKCWAFLFPRRGVVGKRKKCVVFKPVVAPLYPFHLKASIIGIGFAEMGDDEEVISKVMIMEAEDDERANPQARLNDA